jgi:hypothetical protein
MKEGGGHNKDPIYTKPRSMLYYSETQLAPASLIQQQHMNYVTHCYNPHHVQRQLEKKIVLGFMRPILRKDIYYGGSVSQLKEFQTCGGSMASFLAAMTQEPDSSDVSQSDSSRSGDVKRRREPRDQKCSKFLRRLIDFQLLKQPDFLFLLLTFVMWTGRLLPLFTVDCYFCVCMFFCFLCCLD